MKWNDLLTLVEVGHGILLATFNGPSVRMNIALDPLIEDAAAGVVHEDEEPAVIVDFILAIIVVQAVDEPDIRVQLGGFYGRALRIPIRETITDLVSVAAFKFGIRIEFVAIMCPFVIETI